MDQAQEAIWTEYLQRKRAERLREADQLWDAFEQAGGGDASVLAIDFVHVSPLRERADSIQSQLSENYAVTLEPASDGYWLVKGTTRPYGNTLSRASHSAWVEFMCDVAESHGAFFSSWGLECPAHGITLSSEGLDGGG